MVKVRKVPDSEHFDVRDDMPQWIATFDDGEEARFEARDEAEARATAEAMRIEETKEDYAAVDWVRYATRVLNYIKEHHPDVLQEALDSVPQEK